MFPLLLVYKCMRLSHWPGVCLTSRKPASISKIQRDTLSWKAGWKLGAVPVTSCDTRFLNGSRLDSQGENWSWFGGTVLTDAMWGLCTSQKTSGKKHGPFWRWRSTKTTHFVTPGREDLALIASWLDHENCLGGIRLTMAYTSLHHPTPKYVGCCPYMFIYPGIFWLSMTFHSGSSRIQGWFLSLKDGEPFRAPRDKLYHLGWRNFQLDIADIAVTFWWQKDTGLWTKQISLGIWWYM